MDTISAEPPLPVLRRADTAPRGWQRSRRRVLVGLLAMLVICLSLPFLTTGFETKPTSVLVDGWRQEFPVESDKSTVVADDSRKAVLELWTEDGWLIACRKSLEGDLEWQVVLAKTNVAEEPKVTQTPDDLTIVFGAYSIHDASSGDLRIRRQLKKSGDQWPTLELGKSSSMVAGTCWNVHLSGQQIGEWGWITGGPIDWKKPNRNDLWLRFEQCLDTNLPYGISSGLFSLQFSSPEHKAFDDGRQFTANRVMSADIAKASKDL